MATCIEQVGIGFLFAPRFHPAMKHAIGPRRELGQRTIFNLLGPLTNPAGATHQLIGVYDPPLTHPMAEVLGALGGQAAFVVHGHGGLDELTTGGLNRISHLRDGRVITLTWTPPSLACAARNPETCAAASRPRTPACCARFWRRGSQPAPRRGAAQRRGRAGHRTRRPLEGLREAERALDSGAALDKLDALMR